MKLRCNANAVVLHGNSYAVITGFGTNVQNRGHAKLSITKGIADEIEHHLDQGGLVADHDAQLRVNFDRSSLVLDFSSEQTKRLFGYVRDINGTEDKLGPADAAILEEIVDQPVHLAGRVLNSAHIFFGLRVQNVTAILDQNA